MKKYENEIDKLYDSENTEPIYIKNKKGEEVPFEHIALLPLEDDQLYAILRPLKKTEGVDENACMVFSILVDDNANEYLEAVKDDETIDRVFDLYNAIIAAENDNY